jgi:site-specific recombinase XerD
LAGWLTTQGYCLHYTRQLVFCVKRTLDAFHLTPGSTWTAEQLRVAFRRYRRAREYRHARRAFGSYLRSVGRLIADTSPHLHRQAIEQYLRYLSEVKGLAPDSIVSHRWEVGAFLRRTLPSGNPIQRLTADAIEEYVQRRSTKVVRRSLHHTIEILRVFLRYCFDARLITARLDSIELPQLFREELPPRAIKWALIQRLLRSIDRTSRTGWRDFTILHLMAHYGLRNGEVARLTMESVDWHGGTLLVEQTKTHSWLQLPVQKKTLRLLARYLRQPRPASAHQRLFQHGRAPFGPMQKADISQLFKYRVRQSRLPIKGSAYSLRHSFAMRLFARGVGVKAIGDLMGHGNIASTSIYLRLQTDMLREVALPVPLNSQAVGGAK